MSDHFLLGISQACLVVSGLALLVVAVVICCRCKCPRCRPWLYVFLCFGLCVAAQAGSVVTSTITITNHPADGDTLVVNGSTRTWKTSVATPSSQITIGGSIGANATNLFNQAAGTPFTTLTLNRSGTNGITLRGAVDQALTVAITGTWGSYALSTNTTVGGDEVRSPASAYATASRATNIYSQIATDLGTFSSNSLAAGTTLLVYVVQVSGNQTIAGNKTFNGATVLNNAGNYILGGVLSNVLLNASSASITNAYFYGAVNVSNAAPKVVIYDTSGGADEKATTITSYGGDFTVNAVNDAASALSVILRVGRTGYAVDSVALPNGELQVGDSGTASIGTGTGLKVTGHTRWPRTDIGTLANGNNAGVDLENYTFCRVTAGPTGAFAINGIANGADGQVHIIYNSTGQNMTIANDSGVDPTPANRIYTGTGADVSTTGNGCVTVIYDAAASRWVVVSLQQ